MKKNSLLSIILLAVLASSASAAQGQAQSEAISLPNFIVQSERYADAEQHVNASLNALRAQAATPVAVSLELPALKARVAALPAELAGARLAKF